MSVLTRSIGAPVDRIEGREKVTGKATYAFEYEQENVAYAAIVGSTIANGTVRKVDPSGALALPGVLAVLSHENAPALPAAEGELAVLQSNEVRYRGQIVAAVVAAGLETARQAAAARARGLRRWRSTTSSSAPTIPASTGRRGSIRTFRPTRTRATSSGRSRRRRSPSTRRTPPPRSTTTRWSRTPRSRSGRTAGSRSTTRTRARGASRKRSRGSSGSRQRRFVWSLDTSAAASARRARPARTSSSQRCARGTSSARSSSP